MTLIDHIANEIALDDEDRTVQSAKLAAAYRSAPFTVQEIIDDCFVALCGWKLSSLIKNTPTTEV